MSEPVRILLVEDERKLATALKARLGRAGWEVDVAGRGDTALEMARSRHYDLLVLDLGLPGLPGLEVLSALRAESRDVPVLILSARGDVEDRVAGLTGGADDYLAKPFDVEELRARVEAILRRSGVSRITVLEAGDLVMDVVARKVTRGGRTIHLAPREFELLEFFLRNRNTVLTRRRIAEQVWGYTFDTGTNIVDVYVSYLRRALEDGPGERLIHTVVGQGFVLRDE